MSKIIVEGKGRIYAKILADSISPEGFRLTTMEISYPRIILAELNTHRMLSKNSSSSRAIPANKMFENLTGMPVSFGANQAGMQAGKNLDENVWNPDKGWYSLSNISAWEAARKDALAWAKAFSEAGYHKQVFNRLTEPFQMMKTVISGTEWDNFFWLRNDESADPTLQELARCMQEVRNRSEPEKLHQGEWHLPYISTARVADNRLYYIEENNKETYLTLDEAIIVSCARCAAVSFRNVDYDLEKSKQVFDRLLNGGKIHGSAFEHCATPIAPKYLHYYNQHDDIGLVETKKCVNIPSAPSTWQNGISHIDKGSNLWSGNFKGWIQYRKTLNGENYNDK